MHRTGRQEAMPSKWNPGRIAALLMLSYLERRARKESLPQDRSANAKERSSPKKPGDVFDISIVVTTHCKRFTQAKILLSALRSAVPHDVPIYVVVNSHPSAQDDRRLQSQFVREISQNDFVFPICLGRETGISELWNIGIRHTSTEQVILLGDDTSFSPDTLSAVMLSWLKRIGQEPMTVLNDSWGHFSISKSCVRDVGYFDERFLGFGEEDGDYLYRFVNHYGKNPIAIKIPGLHNVSSEVGFEDSVRLKGKYSLFNAVMLEQKYSFGETSNSLDTKFLGQATAKLPNVDPYPLDNFRSQFSWLLFETDQNLVSNQLKLYFEQAGGSPPGEEVP